MCACAREAVRSQMSTGRAEAARRTVDSGCFRPPVVHSGGAVRRPGHRHHCPHFRRLNGSWLRRVLAQRETESGPSRTGSDEPVRCCFILVLSQHGDDSAHRSTEVAVRILDPAIRPGCLGLVLSVQHSVESAIKRKNPGMLEGQTKCASIGR